MSPSRKLQSGSIQIRALLFAFIGCCLFLSTGCGKVPTWSELTSKDKAEETAETSTTPPSPTSAEKNNSVPTPTPEPLARATQRTPQQVIEGLMKTNTYERSDAQLEELANLPENELGQIVEMDLSGARKISADGLASLSKLPNLKVLKLNGMKGLTTIFAGISGLTELEVFAAQSSSFDEQCMQYLAPLTNLRVLDLNGTRIGDEGFIHLQQMKKLEEIHVHDCGSLTGRGFQALKGAPLRVVMAGKSQFGQYGLFHLKGCRTLEELGASNCGVTDQSLLHIKSCGNLKRLIIGFNSLSDLGAKQLGAHRKLVELSLRNTRGISDRGLVFLKNMKNLESLDLEGTAVSSRGAEALRKLLHKCTILYQGHQLKGKNVAA